jgi:hypothetical protein
MYKYKNLFIEIVDSPDDGGYYAEIMNENGETIHTTLVKEHIYQAEATAQTWVEIHTTKGGAIC